MTLLRYKFEWFGKPVEYSPTDLHGLVRRCADEWEKAVGRDLLRFEFEPSLGFCDLVFRFAEHPQWPLKIARCETTEGLSVISFDPRAKWEVSRWQRWFGRRDGQSFISLCLHEMGHALGCSHSPDPSSIMYHAPRGAKVNANVAAFVRAKLEGHVPG